MRATPLSRPGLRPPGDPALRARDEKLESLKAVAGKLAHDFNNFLVPQFGYVTLLKEELPGDSRSAQYLETMEAAARKTEGYIESILLGMRPHRQFSPGEFSFEALLNTMLDRWSAENLAEVEVQRRIESCTLLGDERHWRNALEHLLSNARYALATGGRLEVELTRRKISGEEIARLGLGGEDMYVLVMRDHGFGMTSRVADRAFEPFFTTRTQIKAAGLGLTIVHSVTQVHGGQVELRSVEDQGTTVTLWIPAAGARSLQKPGELGASSSPALQERKKVLLIEDDPLVKEVLRDWLGRFGLEVRVAASADEAEKLFERGQSQWALVICEADLREARGEEIYARFTAGHARAPWIFLAGNRKPEIQAGAEDGSPTPMLMQKPVTLRALAEVVRKHAAL